MFDLLSESAHATMDGLLSWVAIDLPDGRKAMPVDPRRNPEFANAMLLQLTLECRDFARITGIAFDREVAGLPALDAELVEMLEKHFVPDAETDDKDSEISG